MADDPMFPEWRRDWHRQLIAAHGEEKAHALILGNPSHAYIFPNLALIGSQIRVMQPTAVDHTKMFVYPHVLAGVPDEVNLQRIEVGGDRARQVPRSDGGTSGLSRLKPLTCSS